MTKSVIMNAGAVLLCILMLAAGSPSVPQELSRLYDQKQYQKVLDELAKLNQETSAIPEVRRLRTRTLLKLGNPKDALAEYDNLEAGSKQEDLPLLREVAFGFIVVMLKDMREQMRGAAYTALKEIESDDVVPYFEDGLTDGSSPVRALAVEGLKQTKAGRKSKKLRDALQDPAGEVRSRVVKALGKNGDRSVVPLIEQAAKDELTTVRIAAFGALIRLGRTEAWEELRKAAESANPEERAEALRTMADLGDQRSVPLMKQLLNHNQPSVRAAAARGLANLHRNETRQDIEKLLDDPVAPVRRSAATALADLGSKDAVPALTRKLRDPVVSVRAGVAEALLQLDEPFASVGPTLMALAQHNDPASRSSAAFALGKASKVNKPEAIVVLASLAADPLPGPKIVAIRSLGHIGDRGILPGLKEALHDQNEAVRATAGGALLHVMAPVK